MEPYDVPLNPDPLLEHATWIRKLAVELVHDPGAADDLVQETWLAFLRAKPDTDRPLRPWLGRVLRNAAALRARRRAGQAAREAEVARPEEMPSTHDLVERAEQQQRLVRAILALDDPYRSTILLRYFEGLTPKEIAALRELPAVTVRTHLHRGLRQLRERLDQEHGGDRRAWILLLRPLLPASEPAAAGIGVAGLLAGAGLALLGLFGLVQLFGLVGGGGAGSHGELVADGGAHTTEPRASTGALVSGPGARASLPLTTAGSADALRLVTLVDARTGRALPDFRLRHGDRDLVSDARGRVKLPPGARTATPVDHPGLAVERVASHGRRERAAPQRADVTLAEGDRLQLAVGPTFRVDLARSPGVAIEDLEGRLTGRGLSELGDDAGPRQLAPLRAALDEEGTPWLRFAAPPDGQEVAGVRWRLELRDDAGFAWGVAPLEDPAPLDAPLLEIELSATSVLAGRIDGGTSAERHGAVVSLHRTDDSTRVVAWTPVDDDGRYELRWVEPGDYDIRVTAPTSEPMLRRVALRPARRHDVDLRLEPLAVAGPLAGEIESASGQYRGQLLVFLFHGGRVLDVYPTTWRAAADGRQVASFAFDQAPVGDLRLDVLSLSDAVTFEVEPQVVRAPDETVRVRLRDEEPAADVGFEVVDAATGVALERFEVEVRVDGGAPRRFLREPAPGPGEAGPSWVLVAGEMRWNRFSGRAPLRALPRASDVAWTVRAEGYEAVSGGPADFRYAEEDLRIAQVRLRAE